MKVSLARTQLRSDRSPLVAILVSESSRAPEFLPAAWKKAASAPFESKDFTGKLGTTARVYNGKQRGVLVGLGPADAVDGEALRRGAAAASKAARASKQRRLALSLDVRPFASRTSEVDVAGAGRAVAEGLVLGAYSYHGQKTSTPGAPAITRASVFLARKGASVARFGAGLKAGQAMARGQCLARDLGNGPGNVVTPTALAREARKMAKRLGLRCKVVGKAELVKRKFGGLLGVNQGSHEAPVFIEMEYRPKKVKKTLCIIGKGITFDTGGISLKPPAGMEEMKYDMCGSAAVFGAMQAIGELKPRHVRVVGLVPATDNMPSGTAIKPGDVLTTYGGVSVEVVNTDAEGRLVLADALGRAQELKPDYAIDLATLTGACVIALGHRATGLFSDCDELRAGLVEAGDEVHERCWPLPHWTEYQDDIRSAVADVKNVGPRWGGAVTAYAFLKKMAGDMNWAHMDIAGTGWDMPKREHYSGGATGTGVRTLVRFVENLD